MSCARAKNKFISATAEVSRKSRNMSLVSPANYSRESGSHSLFIHDSSWAIIRDVDIWQRMNKFVLFCGQQMLLDANILIICLEKIIDSAILNKWTRQHGFWESSKKMFFTRLLFSRLGRETANQDIFKDGLSTMFLSIQINLFLIATS